METESLYKMTSKHKKKIAEAVSGKNNSQYKDGRRSYREKVNAPQGSIVHHLNGDSKDNSKSNLEIIPKSKRSEHEKEHKRQLNFKSNGGRKPVPRGYKAKR